MQKKIIRNIFVIVMSSDVDISHQSLKSDTIKNASFQQSHSKKYNALLNYLQFIT